MAPTPVRARVSTSPDARLRPRALRTPGRFAPNLSEQLAQFSPGPVAGGGAFSRTLPKASPLSTPGTSQKAQPPTPPLTPPLTPPEGTQMKPQVVVGRWLPPYGQEAPL